jgi:hypothetical protein
MGQVVERLSSKLEALSLNPSTTTEKKKRKKNLSHEMGNVVLSVH